MFLVFEKSKEKVNDNNQKERIQHLPGKFTGTTNE